ncbi:hypothetical protein EXIGLDRAFT_777955 [Exidia glandulosa HHB12029]|uniref:Uncharacterized protein n=1 Tax=Exidia glandulosa HHB12029 TaxID=1314781 RepID=A0A165CT73_EXIGL|nr:hypothetical protein EXIGLDRAFT_777955 [Exidia glandulosa HHB12029]
MNGREPLVCTPRTCPQQQPVDSDRLHSPNSQQDAPAATSADSMIVDNSVTANISLPLVDTFENQSISSGSGGTPPTASTDATAFDYPA